MIALLTPEQQEALELRRAAQIAALRKVGRSKRDKHGTGSFGGGNLLSTSKGKRKSVHAYLKARPREQPRRDRARPAWGTLTEIQTLTRWLNATSGKKAARALICAEHGVANTGRQWRKIRKAGGHIRTELRRRKALNRKQPRRA